MYLLPGKLKRISRNLECVIIKVLGLPNRFLKDSVDGKEVLIYYLTVLGGKINNFVTTKLAQ